MGKGEPIELLTLDQRGCRDHHSFPSSLHRYSMGMEDYET